MFTLILILLFIFELSLCRYIVEKLPEFETARRYFKYAVILQVLSFVLGVIGIILVLRNSSSQCPVPSVAITNFILAILEVLSLISLIASFSSLWRSAQPFARRLILAYVATGLTFLILGFAELFVSNFCIG